MRTFTLRRIKFSPQLAGSRRIERRLTGSEPVVRPLHQKPVRVGGIEPPPSVWKTDVLPLHHTRVEQAAEAGIEPAGDVLNRHAQLPTVAPPQCGDNQVILSEAKNLEPRSKR